VFRKLSLLLFLFAGVVNSSFAETYPEAYVPMPWWCIDGAWNQGNVSVKIKESSDPKWKFSDFTRLDMEVPGYLLAGFPVRLKGDGVWALDSSDTIYFYDSVSGYLGKDKSNFEGNAYLTYTPAAYAGQQVQMYVMKNLPGVDNISLIKDMQDKKPSPFVIPPCSKKDVYFQNKPYAGPTAYFDNTNPIMYVPIYYQLDPNSKAVREGVQATITLHSVTAKAGDSISTLKVSGQSGTVSLPNFAPRNAGTVTFSVEVNDGVYSSDRTAVGVYRPICRYRGYTWTYQTGPGVGGDPNGFANCGWDANGNVCPGTVVPLGRYQYPLLQYTCL
jgi:hypothetical protein